MIFGRMHTRKWDPGILFPNGMGWITLLIVGVQCKQWDPGIVFSPIDFKLFGKQEVCEMDSPLNKVMLNNIVQQQAWWFLSKIFMESQTQNWTTQWQLQRIIQKAGYSTTMFEIDSGQPILGRDYL